MNHPKVSNEEMLSRIVRFSDYTREKAIPLMFIDSLIPGHHRLNYAVVGDTASENPDYEVMMSHPHKFQIGLFKAMPNGNGPAYHTHDYVEIFLPLEGKWRFYYGNDPDGEPEGEIFLEKWDFLGVYFLSVLALLSDLLVVFFLDIGTVMFSLVPLLLSEESMDRTLSENSIFSAILFSS